MRNRIRDWFNSAPTVPWIGRFAIAAVVAVFGLGAVAMAYFLHYGDDGWTDAHRTAAAGSSRRSPSTTQRPRTRGERDGQIGDTSGCDPRASIDDLLVCAADNSEAELNAADRRDATTRGWEGSDGASADATCAEQGDAGPALPEAHLGSDWTTYRPDIDRFPVALELPENWSVEQDQGVRAVVASDDDTGAVVVLADLGAGAPADRLPQMIVEEFGGTVRLLGSAPDIVNGVDVCRSLFDAGGSIVETVAVNVDGRAIVAGAVWWDSIGDTDIELARTVLASIDIGAAA